MDFSDSQLAVIESPVNTSLFLHGPAGTGKTTTGVERLSRLVESGIEGRKILLYFPHRNLGARYQSGISALSYQGNSLPVSATFGGIARRMLDLFWPSILANYTQFQPGQPPTFLTLESSLYFLSQIVEPLILDHGFFSTVTIQRNRLYSQILDNLNKSAVHGFSHTSIAERLLSSWIGDSAQETIYDQAQEAANQFRQYCYSHNLLDFSLQVELFIKAQNDLPLMQSYLQNQFSHLIYDNAEEDFPVSHDFIRNLLPSLSSSLIIFDEGAGYRSFLGASPASALEFQEICKVDFQMQKSFTSSESLIDFDHRLTAAINKQLPDTHPAAIDPGTFSFSYQSFYPQLADWIASKILELLDNGVDPEEIVILAPFLSDSLRFLLEAALEKESIPFTSHRPSRPLRDEPVTQCLLTLSALAHPGWEVYPSVHETSLAFFQAIDGLDLTRAYLLAKNALHTKSESPLRLADFERFPGDVQERITFHIGNRYQELLEWLASIQAQPPLALDFFISRMFGEILTQRGFGFYDDISKGRITAQIMESIAKFRKTAADVLDHDVLQTGKEYYRMVKTGVLANQYLRSWTEVPPGKVLLAPAYTFLLYNKAVDFQFWLDIGSRGWYERIYQPLTNPHVLHRGWNMGDLWTDVEETQLNITTLTCLTTGLIRRCKTAIYGCLTETDERGFEQKGLLLQSLNSIYASYQKSLDSAGDRRE